MYYRHIWNQGEMEKCYQNAYFNNPNNQSRFGGILLPFLGGLLIGGMFMPHPNNYQPIPYQPYPYYPEYPIYYSPNSYQVS